MLDCLNDELVITGHIEKGATGSRIAEFNQWLTAKGIQVIIRPDAKKLSKVTEGNRCIGLETKVIVVMGRCQVAPFTGKEDALHHVEVLHEDISLWFGAQAAHSMSDA